MEFRIEFGMLPKPRRGLVRVCPADTGIESDALWIHKHGVPLRSAVRMAVARYDAVFDTFRKVQTLDEENSKARGRLELNLLYRDKREPYERSTQKLWLCGHDEAANIADLPKVRSDDLVVRRVYASILRRLKAKSPR